MYSEKPSMDSGFWLHPTIWNEMLHGLSLQITGNGFEIVTVETHKSLHHKSLRFAIFWEIFENCQLKTLD